ncbi:uncharacterized protein [Blastocystis hominis]|uniref:Uncharacterized protein n=1 Tax=Blastocystis hominis TaxID=12968 RepID=D8MAZ9_BLAHO|nr:uncharacterized protein [Blastocystis hominis]CBK25238.2 unnamed protein product [Blastocystis hominis]|eukprot:XP_012899286.1 uncharacterized protein [Blastocystis hominis]
MSNHEGTLLAIILDLNIDSWILQTEQSRDSPAQFIECLEGLFGFIGSFIVQSHCNQLLFAVYGAGEPTILFPKCDENIALNLKFHSQQPKNVRRFLFPKIIELMKSDHAVKSSLDSCLSRTLCYILLF